MRILGVLGVVVVRGMADIRVRIAVVALADLSAAVVVALTLRSRRACFPLDVLAWSVVTGDQGTATTTTAVLSPQPGRVAVLACLAGLHGLAGVLWLVVQAVLDSRAHLGPVLLGPVVAKTAVLADLAVPDNGPSGGRVDVVPVDGEAARKELDELLHVAWLVQLGLPRGRHGSEVICQCGDLGGGCTMLAK